MENPVATVPLTEDDIKEVAKLATNKGFNLLRSIITAKRDFHLLSGSFVRVDTPTPNGIEEAEINFKSAERYESTLKVIEETLQLPTYKETKYVSTK